MCEVMFTLKLLAVFGKSVVRIELETMHHLLARFSREIKIRAFAAVERHSTLYSEVMYIVLHICQGWLV